MCVCSTDIWGSWPQTTIPEEVTQIHFMAPGQTRNRNVPSRAAERTSTPRRGASQKGPASPSSSAVFWPMRAPA